MPRVGHRARIATNLVGATNLIGTHLTVQAKGASRVSVHSEAQRRSEPSKTRAARGADPFASRSIVHLTGASMRFLEMGLALAAIATAVLIGVGR